ncbi:MAG: SAM-dependent methyltransferase [Betaproteobacteria bacterium]|nr:SAM-dependent methyltransferase [Betaproteobacteria bacterium]
MSAAAKGKLHLIPVALGGDPVQAALPQATLDLIATLDYFIVENEKSARRFLKHIPHPKPLQQLQLELFDKGGDATRAIELLQPLNAGRSAGVLSEAGCPTVADPGALLVEAAHRAGLRVVPHVGPSALLLALMASGFNGQRFAFHGYLPVPKDECRGEIGRIERESRAGDQTQIFIETPYRNDVLLRALLEICSGKTRLCVASDLTLPTETVRSATIAEWKQGKTEIGRRPSVFLLYAR